ncbi:MAG: carbonic anhydrase [Planctomycetes bacterium]|nr:carbonic anhydrase [Planctomycetota bacterium]
MLFFTLCLVVLTVTLAVYASDSGRVRTDDFADRDPDDVLRQLKEGNAKFVAGDPRVIDGIINLRERLAKEGQEPIATIIACSDSRIPVEDIFHQPLGQLFVVSTAGNAADTPTQGTVRYGVEHLHTPVVVVMGHNHCGAIKAVVVRSEESGKLGELLETIAAVRDSLPGDLGDDEDAERKLAVANVEKTAEKLLADDDFLRKKVDKGELRIVKAMYHIKTGEVEWL